MNFTGYGEGPLDLVVVPGWVSHLEANWDDSGRAYASPPGMFTR